MNSLFAAFRFLTIIPIPGRRGHDVDDLRHSLWCFPLVGLFLGGATGGIFYMIGPHLPWAVAAVLALLLLFLWSGGLHLDGVADCCDGFFSARPKARVLEIMRDSRIGSMGVVGLVLLLALKGAALMSVRPDELWRPLLIIPLAGRVAILVMMGLLPYARPEGGLATVFYGGSRLWPPLIGVVLLGVLGWLAAGALGLMSGLNGLILLLPFFLYCYFRIGGATGDTLGAACELGETFTALAYACMLGN